jgi:hypothetical protein
MGHWNVDQVGEWLKASGFEKQIKTFKGKCCLYWSFIFIIYHILTLDRNIDGSALKGLTDYDIPEILIVLNEDGTIKKPTIGAVRRFREELSEWKTFLGQMRKRKTKR